MGNVVVEKMYMTHSMMKKNKLRGHIDLLDKLLSKNTVPRESVKQIVDQSTIEQGQKHFQSTLRFTGPYSNFCVRKPFTFINKMD